MVAVFIGHSDCTLPVSVVKTKIRDMINSGVRQFLNGGMGAFDAICARAVYELKEDFPYIESILVIPYLNFKCLFAHLFDGSIYPEGLENYHYKAAINKRNDYMLDSSDVALCYVYTLGRCLRTYKGAIKRKLILYHLCEPPKTLL